MVIQSNMSPKSIVKVWENTVSIFIKYNVPLTESKLENTIEADTLTVLLNELNAFVNSSSDTCIVGG